MDHNLRIYLPIKKNRLFEWEFISHIAISSTFEGNIYTEYSNSLYYDSDKSHLGFPSGLGVKNAFKGTHIWSLEQHLSVWNQNKEAHSLWNCPYTTLSPL